MRKLTLLSALLLVGLLSVPQAQAQTYRFKSTPHLPIYSGQTVIDQMYIPTNVRLANVTIGIYCKTVYYGSLRIVLTAPKGNQIILKNELAFGSNYAGSLGHERSWALFQDGGRTMDGTTMPNDLPFAPAQMLANLTGKDAQGWWTLSVMDNRNSPVPYQNGFLEGWSVNFNAVVIEPEAVLWRQVKTGSQLVGQLNGQTQIVPNEKGGLEMCTVAGVPNVTPGKNGEAYPFIISGLGIPGLLIGQPVPGYVTPGRFRVTVDIATSYPGVQVAAYTGDIAIYFGRAPQYNPPLQSPPSPPNMQGTASQWPTGSGGWTNQLQGGNPTQGGVRLSACNNFDSPPWFIPANDMGGYTDCTFDDRALISITQAEVCGGPMGSGVCGAFRPELPLSGLNGNPVEGLYYVTVYDTFGEGNVQTYGQLRVLRITVEYLAGGGETENPMLHQGIAGPLMGVPIPGPISGYPFGYLADVITTLPPYSIHAKEQDPILFFWGVQKLGPRSATGYENLQARSGASSFTTLAADGPYAYPGTLVANPQQAGLTVNADVGSLPLGNYYLRSVLSQQRYDDDNTDNWFETQNPLQITPTTLAYYGEKINQWNDYQSPGGSGVYASFPFQSQGSSGSGIGQTFTLWRNSTVVTSIDYKIDRGNVVAQTWRTPLRITVWKVGGPLGLIGAPVGPPVARSKTIGADEYMLGNWRSFPLYACDQQGNITNNPSVTLPQGTYVVMLDNMATTNLVLYPYSWGMLPFLTDRNQAFRFNENFGPIGTYATTGTRFMYQYNTGTTAPPSQPMSALSTPCPWSNYCLPMRVNMTTLNDFAIDYLSINGLKGTESLTITAAPFQPNVIVTANSLQGNNMKDFNIRLEIFDGANNRVYLHDRNYGPQGTPPVAGIAGYETVSVPMAQWNPPYGGMYRMRAFFSRKPDDQNPVNDEHEFWLYVSSSRAILATGSGATAADIDAAVSTLRNKGVTVEVMEASDARIAAARGLDIYVMGTVQGDAKNVIAKAIENGNNIGIVYERKANIGKLLRVVDNVFDIERPNADYDRMTLFPRIEERSLNERPVRIPETLPFKTVDELVAQIKALRPNVEPVQNDPVEVKPIDEEIRRSMIPVETRTPYGELRTVDVELGDLGVLFVSPTNRKPVYEIAEAVVPGGFGLEQNYPNPFNPSTSISYSLPQASVVTLRVIDMLGREVATIVNETQAAGRYTVTWKGMNQNGESVASGTYIYRIDAVPVDGSQPFTGMRKMTLSK
ncbi:MAG: FlgD immunoglobulin-like domain containing protein [Bacteroidota bacterium]|nr:FlgD immunoglobulin-like domain containing protein [Bacteroidota bacterium]